MAEAVTESIAERDMCCQRMEEMDRPRARGRRGGGTRCGHQERRARGGTRGAIRGRPAAGFPGLPLDVPPCSPPALALTHEASRLRRDQVLALLEDYPFPEVLYVELWMVATLFGE